MNRINRHSLMKAPFGRLCVTGLATLGLMIVPARATEADTFVVNSIEDLPDFSAGNGKCATSILFPKCTLRAAVMEANALSGAPHTIVIPSGTYTLTRVSPPGEEHLQNFGPLRIFTSMKLEASNGVAVVRGDAGWPHRIFTINLNVTVSMTGLDIANGHAQDGLSGGAVRIAGFGSVVTLTDVTVRNSTVQNANGGGISNNGALTLDRCVIRNNGAAGVGGGLETFGATVIKESVIRENSAEFGGGIASFGTT